ncbi:MAG: PAS domain S-box protein, partial [Ktedonobacterales bacterium]
MENALNTEGSDYLAAYSGSDTAGPPTHISAESPDAFRTTVELSASGICHIDTAGRLLYVNPALCQITGYSRDEMLRLTLPDIFHPEDVAVTMEDFRRLITGEVPVCRMERRYRRYDGSMVWVHLNATLRRTQSGAPQYVIAIIDDISELKRLEDQLRATNQQLALAMQESQQQAHDLEATFEAITDLVIVFDKAGTIRRMNKAAREFMGLQPALEAARQRVGALNMHGQPLPPEQLASSRVLRGETLTGAHGVDTLTYSETGREVLFNIGGAPVRDAQGQIVGGVIVLRDVTERRQLERHTQEALQALLEMAEALVAPAPSPAQVAQPAASVPITSPKLNPVAQRLAELAGRILECRRVGIVKLTTDHDIMHPIAVTGLTPEQTAAWNAALEGRSITDFIGADNMRKLRAGEAVQIDLEQQPLRDIAHGGPVALSVPLRLSDELLGTMALAYDQEPHAYTEDELALAGAVGQMAALVIEREHLLEEREEARAHTLALQEANRRMEEFLGIASHELRTPLASVLGNLQLLQRRLARAPVASMSAEDLAKQLQMVGTLLEPMSRQGKRLTRIVGDMVNTTRIQNGKLDFHLQPRDLAALIREEVKEQRQMQPERVIDLALPDDAPVPVLADADRIGQVVTNYLTNALKYSREDQPVEVRLSVTGDTATVSVHDDGPGLPVEEQTHIWDLFHRVPGINVQSGSGIGLGLGLHISKTIVERHGGQVGVDSAIGRGATF